MTSRRSGAEPRPDAVALATALHGLLQRQQSTLLDVFLQDWPHPIGESPAIAAHSVPALRWLPDLCALAPRFAAGWVAELAAQADRLPWRQSYGVQRTGAAFMNGYGYCELVGPAAAVTSSRLAVGVLLLGPHTHYAAHWHEAEEIYLPLVGVAQWWQGVLPWRPQQPGSVIHHARFEPHAMRTAAAPLLAVYLWRSQNLAQKSQLISGTRR